jgi:hypothetical protein
MAFDTFDPRMKIVAERALAHCRQQFGGNGLVTEQGISTTISWRPSFICHPTSRSIVGVEVTDILYPEILKVAAHDINLYDDVPIAVYQACSLDAYQKDPKQIRVNLLRQDGIGIITVDEDGLAVIQHSSVPLAQHIPESKLENEIRTLTDKLKVCFRAAYKTYLTNIGQGLQQAGQIVEAIVLSMDSQAAKKGDIRAGSARRPLADVIDGLYQENKFRDHRAALGAARSFIKEFRNTASHPAKTAKQATEKMRMCRDGFHEAIGTSVKLHKVFQAMGYKLTVHITQ